MTAGRRTRILIVDDSAVMRSLLRSVIGADDSLEVAGTAADGATALANLGRLNPDMVLLDVEMPVMDGLATLRELRARGHKMPVIMCSSLTQRGARVTIEALASGASDYVAKPCGQPGRETATQALAQELIPKIQALTSPAPARQPIVFPAPARASELAAPGALPAFSGPAPLAFRAQPMCAEPRVLVIGVSTGGPAALDILLPALPAGFPLPVLIVQHMPELFTGPFAERLNGRCRLPVREAAEGEPAQPGTIFIARGNWHLEVLPSARGGAAAVAPAVAGRRAEPPATLHLTQGPLENHCRPAVDVLFRSAASAYESGVLAVVLTGMGSDGMAGARMVHDRGGSVLVQDQASSAVWGMPGAVANAGLAHKVLPLRAIVPEILRIVSRASSEARELRESVI